MQAVLCFSPNIPLTPTRSTVAPKWRLPTHTKIPLPRTRVATADDSITVDYSSVTSVFPAEACETIGGAACSAEMYPEVKLKLDKSSVKAEAVSEEVDREYLEYDEPKTVFPGEACDDLGGEFCEADYQTGVF